MDETGIPLRDLISEYLQYHDGLNHSPATTRWYADILFPLNAFLGEEAVLADLTVPRLRAYQSHLRSRRLDDDRPLSDETLHAHARAIRTFLSWLHREGYLDEDLARRIDLPRVGTKQQDS
ncbi:MAG: phage integrase SAM-like domain-containing protein [Dehalococcoidia bacterium]